MRIIKYILLPLTLLIFLLIPTACEDAADDLADAVAGGTDTTGNGGTDASLIGIWNINSWKEYSDMSCETEIYTDQTFGVTGSMTFTENAWIKNLLYVITPQYTCSDILDGTLSADGSECTDEYGDVYTMNQIAEFLETLCEGEEMEGLWDDDAQTCSVNEDGPDTLSYIISGMYLVDTEMICNCDPASNNYDDCYEESSESECETWGGSWEASADSSEFNINGNTLNLIRKWEPDEDDEAACDIITLSKS